MSPKPLYDETLPVHTINNYINGERITTPTYLDGFDPANDKVFLKIADSDVTQAAQAVSAAENAFVEWSRTDVNERCRLMQVLAGLLEDHMEEFARAESRDQGKPVWLARKVDIPRAVLNFRMYAGSMLYDSDKSTYQESMHTLNYTSKEPVGVALLISPWNLPLYLLTFKMAPALIAGNTIVCKPSEFTSLTASMLCDLCAQAGFPAGVVNIVFGTGSRAGSALVQDPRIRLISFTGSTPTAHKIRSLAAPFNKKLSLELGGKNAAVIFDDCDFDKCIQTTIRSSFMNQGEICLCTSLIFVQKGIYKRFVERFVQETKKLKVGDPKEENFMGPLNSSPHMKKVQGYIDLAKSSGLQILCGQEDLELKEELKDGYFVRPHVITGMSDDSPLMQEEIFGPVTCITPFETEAEVVTRVNKSQYGLSATVWSSNINTVHKVSRQLRVGTVWVNCWMIRDLRMPFGGFKDSGVGREGLVESLEFYTEARVVCVQMEGGPT